MGRGLLLFIYLEFSMADITEICVDILAMLAHNLDLRVDGSVYFTHAGTELFYLGFQFANSLWNAGHTSS